MAVGGGHDLLVGLGEGGRVVLGLGVARWAPVAAAAPISRSAQVRAASVSSPWIRSRLVSETSTGAAAVTAESRVLLGQPDHEMHQRPR